VRAADGGSEEEFSGEAEAAGVSEHGDAMMAIGNRRRDV
jgi:hypothetical protein